MFSPCSINLKKCLIDLNFWLSFTSGKTLRPFQLGFQIYQFWNFYIFNLSLLVQGCLAWNPFVFYIKLCFNAALCILMLPIILGTITVLYLALPALHAPHSHALCVSRHSLFLMHTLSHVCAYKKMSNWHTKPPI